MNAEHRDKLDALRERVGRPSPKEEARYIGMVFPPIRDRYLAAISSDLSGKSSTLLEILESEKRELEGTSRKVSRPYLCALSVRGLMDFCYERALEELNENDIAGFRFDYDLASGLAIPIGRIIMSEAEIGGRFDELIVPAIAKLSDKTEGVGNEVEDYFLHRKSVEADAAILQADPTGSRLVRKEVEELKRYSNPPKGWSLKYLIAGAELSRDLYQGFYQISGKLYSV